ncbi:MAG: hypothetical protein CFE21_19940 [Bacteroidetes bacterium B1(2017)]|nr:MAG: hypothetical protein CFE21_19940 [Bacteroidetes bacterium B1(2017)]
MTSASGANWTCTVGSTVTCTRSTAIAAGTTSTITLLANIASNAPASITNSANVATPGESNSGNNGAASVISVSQVSPDLTISKTTFGSSFQQSGNAIFNLSVTNMGNGPTIGTVTVNDVLPTGLQFVSATGSDWTCSIFFSSITCTRTIPIAASETAPHIQIVTNILSNAPSSILNTATVSGGSETPTNNNGSSTFFSVNAGPAPSIGSPSLNMLNLCLGSNINIVVNINGVFYSGNQFEIQLSDENGSFYNPSIIGNSNTVGNVLCTIPTRIPEGSNYLIRVVSNNPVVIGNSLTGITINQSQLEYILKSPNDDLSGQSVFKSLGIIEASNRVSPPANVVYHAVNSILLLPGFQTNQVFKAEILGCDN